MQIHSASHALAMFTPSYQSAEPASAASHQHSSSSKEAVEKSSLKLSQQEEQALRKLKARDREVRAHEQAHKSAAGGLATGGATFDYEKGPDGRQYAVSGEVKIDASPVEGNPEATIRKAQKVQRAATAPSEPSAQDIQVAAQAFAMQMEAQIEKRRIDQEEATEDMTSEALVTPIKSQEETFNSSFSEKGLSGGETEKTQGVKCSICGGDHSGESHSENNTQKLRQVFQLSDAQSTGLAVTI